MTIDVVFGLARKFDDGRQTSVAINKRGDVVEVHKSQGADTLWYHTGKTRKMDVGWGGSCRYDDGQTPAVALNDNGLVIEAHQSQGGATLWSHVGGISGNSIGFGGSHKYDDGVTPSLALDNSNWCVEVHQSQGNAGLWYHVGLVDPNGKTINWGASRKYDNGTTPRVCMNNYGVIVEVHKSEAYSTLWYRVGVINKGNKTIDWGASHQYDNGVQPAIAMTDAGFVIELHMTEFGDTLWRHVGIVDVNSRAINFGGSSQFDEGQNLSVACASDASMAIQTHQAPMLDGDGLVFSTSLIHDRMRWMEEMYGILQSKQLWEMTLPGSHDSGAFDMNTTRTPCHDAPDSIPAAIVRTYATAHNMSIAGQLQNGCRYFDLRPYCDNGTFFAYHDVEGGNFDTMMSDLAFFLQNTSRELVILKISHFCVFNDTQHQQLIALIKGKLGNSLFIDKVTSLLTTKFGQYVGNGSRALVLYDDDYINTHPVAGFQRYSDSLLYDSYSETIDYAKMMPDQLQKMKDHSGTSGKLFLLSWTLTYDFWGSLNKKPSLQAIASEANRNLGNFLADNAGSYKINILYVDFLADARVTDCAITLNW